MVRAPSEIVRAPNSLRPRPNWAPPLFDERAVERAEAALAGLSGNFQGWMEEQLSQIVNAVESARQEGWSDERLDLLFTAAHDAKGLGGTFDYPLVTALAGSLCRLIETPEGKTAARAAPHLVEAHVQAIKAIVRDEVRTEDHPVGRALLAELEAKVEALGVAPA